MTPAVPDKILDQLTTPVLLLDAEARIAHVNPAFCAWVGIGRRRWLGLGLDALGAPALAELLQQSEVTGQSERFAQQSIRPHTEIELRAAIWVTPLPPDSGWRALVEFHLEADDPAAEARWPQALSATLRGLAHEVRNPLAGLKGAAQLLARRINDPDARRYLEVIEAETARLARLVERLLDPHPARPLTPVNVHEVLERVRLLAEAEAGWACRILRDYDPSLPAVRADDDRLMQALWNLLRNALQAGAAEIRLRTRGEHGVTLPGGVQRLALRIDVIDDGAGVAEELAARVFLPLVSGAAEGGGLGLAISQEIVREHGGAIHFKSRPGHTVFSIWLPLPEQ
ncbi:MAG: nitrogen regulation protein NR(II) [Lysobacterales bacterium]